MHTLLAHFAFDGLHTLYVRLFHTPILHIAQTTLHITVSTWLSTYFDNAQHFVPYMYVHICDLRTTEPQQLEDQQLNEQ